MTQEPTTEDTMTREQLIASLTQIEPEHCWYAPEETDMRYLDWTARAASGEFELEVGASNGDAVQLDMTREEMLALHRALTITLLSTDE